MTFGLLCSSIFFTHTHTHTHIYIYRERERERKKDESIQPKGRLSSLALVRQEKGKTLNSKPEDSLENLWHNPAPFFYLQLIQKVWDLSHSPVAHIFN